jgi:hypothetical protein
MEILYREKSSGRHLTRWSPGEVEQHTRSPFWGSQGEQEGQKRVLGGGEVELRGADCSGRGGQDGGAVLSWGRAGAVQGPEGEGWSGLKQRGGAQQGGDGGLAQGERQRTEREEELRASGDGEFLVEAVLCGEAARGGEGRGRDGQEAHWREVVWGGRPRTARAAAADT